MRSELRPHWQGLAAIIALVTITVTILGILQ
jgi:hypothetical protein